VALISIRFIDAFLYIYITKHHRPMTDQRCLKRRQERKELPLRFACEGDRFKVAGEDWARGQERVAKEWVTLL